MLGKIIFLDLMARGKTQNIASQWASIADSFENCCGLKDIYSREDITLWLGYLRKRNLKENTIQKDIKAIKLLAQIQGWGFPKLSLRHIPSDEIKRTILSKNDIAFMIKEGKKLLKPKDLCYLALSTTYGFRRVEMCQPPYFTKQTLSVITAKDHKMVTHLVPIEISPYLKNLKHCNLATLSRLFQRICKITGLEFGEGYGWHSIRRSLATELILTGASPVNVMRFMRWSDASVATQFRMLAIYAQRDQARIDGEVFKVHPFLPYWK